MSNLINRRSFVKNSAIAGAALGFSPDTIKELERRGHTLREGGSQGAAQVIIYNAKEDMLDGGSDRRASDGAAVGVPGRTAPKATAAR